jgi:hypothetical protein
MKNVLPVFLLFFLLSCGEKLGDPEPAITPVQSQCEGPYDLSFVADTMNWKKSVNTSNSSYYEVQYGKQGFTIGNGTVFTTNNSYSSSFVLNKGNTYDAYVRVYCSSSLGFSSWVGPVSSYADKDHNLCTAPVNLNSTIHSEGVDVTWTDLTNSDNTYEISIVRAGQAPETSTYRVVKNSNIIKFTTLESDVDYHFYIRTLCIDESSSPWRGPLLIEN